MVANVLWAAATSGYITSGRAGLSSELNALANAANSAASAEIDNSAGDKAIFADFLFTAGGTYTPTANGYISIWLLRNYNGTYEDGSASVTPARAPDFVILVRAGTTITPVSPAPMQILPPGKFKVLAQNNTGATLPATGNTITFQTYAIAQ